MAPWQKHLPMAFTVSRMFLVGPIALLMNSPRSELRIAAAVLFILASMTDYWDGYYARKWNAMTNWGKFMDPIADKILVTAVLLMFIPAGKIEPWMVIILVSRDLLIGGIRQVAAADQIIIDASPGGKWKTALQMGAIPAVMIGDEMMQFPFQMIGNAILWVSTVLSLASGAQYFWAYEKARKKPL